MDPLLIMIHTYLDTLYSFPGIFVALYIVAFVCMGILVLVQFFTLRREKAVFLLDMKLRQSVENDMFLINETIIQKNRIIEEMKYMANMYNSFVRDSCDAIVVIEDDKFVECNKAALDIFGCESKEELLLKNPVMFSPEFQQGGESSFVLANQYAESALKNGSCRFEWLHCRRDGTKFHTDVVLTTMTTMGKILQQAIIRDISKSKQAESKLKKAKEDAEKANLAKSDFLAAMSHEIRTPINGIIGMTELVMGSVLNEYQAEFVLAIDSEVSSLLNLVDNILDFSKIEAGQLELEKIDFNLCIMLEDFVRSFSIRASLKGLDFILYIDPDIPSVLLGDPGRLRQILANLVGNALKFTDKGEISIFAEIDHENDETITILFKVSDTGIGIPKEKQKTIFENYTQAESYTTRIYGGTGLGTTIAKQLAELMQGEIHIDSTVGKGSTFWFQARFDKSDFIAPVLPVNKDLKDLKTLIIENNETSREVIARYLTFCECNIEKCDRATKGLSALMKAYESKTPFELIIVALNLPGMDGFEFSRQVRLSKDLNTTPIIVITSEGNRGDASVCKEIGIEGYLTKPVRQSNLIRAIQMIIGVDTDKKINHKKNLVTQYSIAETYQSGGQILLAEDDTIKQKQALLSSANKQLKKNSLKPESELGRYAEIADKVKTATMKILLVEDNSTNRKIISQHIKSAGFKMDIAKNGREGVDSFKRGHYDLIIMDMQMPVMDGYEATKLIREFESLEPPFKDEKKIPIIALTANAVKGDREKCFAAGINDYITKPIKRDQLYEILEKWLVAPSSNKRLPMKEDNSEKIQELPIDYQKALTEFGDDKVFFDEVLTEFITQVDSQINEISAALDTNNAKIVADQAHSIRGGAANLLASGLSFAAGEVEKVGKAGALENGALSLEHLKYEFNRLKSYNENINLKH